MREAGTYRVPSRTENRSAASASARGWAGLPPVPIESDATRAAYRYEAHLRSVARRILGDEDQAEDAVQEALVSLWQAPETPASVRGWLVRTVVHRSLHARRTRDRRRRWENEAGEQYQVAECPLCDPERALDARRELRAMLHAIESLPDDYRAVLELRETGLEYQEIAQRLALPVGTVRSRLSRARRQLQARVGAASSPRRAWAEGVA